MEGRASPGRLGKALEVMQTEPISSHWGKRRKWPGVETRHWEGTARSIVVLAGVRGHGERCWRGRRRQKRHSKGGPWGCPLESWRQSESWPGRGRGPWLRPWKAWGWAPMGRVGTRPAPLEAYSGGSTFFWGHSRISRWGRAWWLQCGAYIKEGRGIAGRR